MRSPASRRACSRSRSTRRRRRAIANCEGKFDTTAECWNIAESNRRVWGLGVWKGPNGETRLYYSVASSPDLGGSDWNSLPDDEKRNTLWSVRLGPDGSFDASGVRREFVLPDFFGNPQDVARAGYSRPVSDITFPACSGRPVMLVAERGGLRNLGLGQENAFATPHEARTIRYELDQSGTWRAMGRYDVGMYDRSKEGAPYINANCAGGATFGPGYSADGQRRPDRPTGSSGSPATSCARPTARAIRPAASGAGRAGRSRCRREGGPRATSPTTRRCMAHKASRRTCTTRWFRQPRTPRTRRLRSIPIGPDQAYMVDLDINVDRPAIRSPNRSPRTTRP